MYTLPALSGRKPLKPSHVALKHLTHTLRRPCFVLIVTARLGSLLLPPWHLGHITLYESLSLYDGSFTPAASHTACTLTHSVVCTCGVA